MNPWSDANDFELGLRALLVRVDLELEKQDRDTFSDLDPNRVPHEHDTRLLFIDELLTLLGWDRGIDGNVREEVRLKGETTRFMDYLGVSALSNKAHLLVEAKAWDVPAITARNPSLASEPVSMMVKGLNHIKDQGQEKDCPINKVWDGYLRQVVGYVQVLKDSYGHELPRAVLISGEWMAIFLNPVATFLGNPVEKDIVFILRADFCAKAPRIFELLHRSKVTADAPIPLRPAQLSNYIAVDDVRGVYRGVHIVVEKEGSKIYGVQPRLRVFPALHIARKDGAVISVTNGESSFVLSDGYDDEGKPRVEGHIDEIGNAIDGLIAQCSRELSGKLEIDSLSNFPGFKVDRLGRELVRPFPGGGEWLAATGADHHFILREPRIAACQFHCWSSLHPHRAVRSPVSMPSVSPQCFFPDGQPHHCANQVILDRREKRCQVHAVDSRVCCQACAYLDQCWKPEEKATSLVAHH